MVCMDAFITGMHNPPDNYYPTESSYPPEVLFIDPTSDRIQLREGFTCTRGLSATSRARGTRSARQHTTRPQAFLGKTQCLSTSPPHVTSLPWLHHLLIAQCSSKSSDVLRLRETNVPVCKCYLDTRNMHVTCFLFWCRQPVLIPRCARCHPVQKFCST